MRKRRQVVAFIAFGMTMATSIGLQVPSWAAELRDVRVKPRADKTEIILDLDAPAEDMVMNPQNPKALAIQFSGSLAPSLKTQSLAIPGRKNLQSAYWEAKDGKVQVFLKRQAPSDTGVYALQNPSRLVIRVNEDYELTETRQIEPGIVHQHILKTSSHGPLNINVLQVDPSKAPLRIEPMLATGSVHGKARVTQMVSRSGALAGINASFFKPDSGTVLGTTILNRELLAGPIYNRVSLGITADNGFKMARIAFRGKVTTDKGDSLVLHNVNQPRLAKEQSILYSSRWGAIAPPCSPGNVAVQISKTNEVLDIAATGMMIPTGGYVLIGPEDELKKALQLGEIVSLQVYTSPDWSDVTHALSGGPYLVHNGSVYVDAAEQAFRSGAFTRANPRTAVGFTADNRLLMVTVDGRQEGVSDGATLYELANLLKSLGAVEAMNLDGGSSTQMVVKGRLVNRPTMAGGVAVSSALVVRQAPPALGQEIIGTTSHDLAPANF